PRSAFYYGRYTNTRSFFYCLYLFSTEIYTFSIRHTAYATTPSSLPINPIVSFVVALIEISSISMPAAFAIFSFMAEIYGFIFGASKHSILSILHNLNSRTFKNFTHSSSKRRLLIPFHLGSVFGK